VLFCLCGILAALIIMPLGKLSDRPLFIPLGLGVVALAMGMIAISFSYTLLLVSLVIFAFGMAMYFTSVSAILAESVPVIWVGTAMGIYGLLEDVGWMIGPAVGGWLLNYGSIHTPFAFSAVVAAFGVPLFLWGRRKMPADAKQYSRSAQMQDG